jgi:hypothetical protein
MRSLPVWAHTMQAVHVDSRARQRGAAVGADAGSKRKAVAGLEFELIFLGRRPAVAVVTEHLVIKLSSKVRWRRESLPALR